MSSEAKLLEYLAAGHYCSGEELGQLLGVSRTAVWKQVNKLSEMGVEIESVKGRGYRIAGGLSLLSEPVIRQQLSALSAQRLSVLTLEQSTASTNQLARLQAEQGDATGLSVFAEQQTAGRGRRGRNWVSPFGRNIYLSMVWGFDTGVEALEGLSLAVGVAMCRAVERCGVAGIQLKWPNDLLWRGQKVGGILLEVIGDPAGFCQVIVGVGINVNMHDQVAEAIDQQWTDINKIAGATVDRSVLAGCVLDELLQLLGDYEQSGFAAYRREWLSRDAFADQPVKLIMVNKEVAGVARGVGDSGALCLEVDGGIEQFSGGEISLRGLP